MIDLYKLHKKEKAKIENKSQAEIVATDGLQRVLLNFVKRLMDDPKTSIIRKHKLARLRGYIDINFKNFK